MNFFEHQDQARKSSRRLVFLFVLAVISIVVAINVVTVVLVGFINVEAQAEGRPQIGLVGPLLLSTVLTVALIGGGSLYRTASLRSGGGAVARAMGGTPVSPDSRDSLHLRLHNVVEEMAIAAGMPVPEVYVLEQESGINAFAAGYGAADAAVAVSRGALEELTREELQGVIAHEFSHILNGDMRLNIRLMGVLFGILLVSIAGRELLYAMRHGDSRKAGPILIFAIAMMILGWIGLMFGRAIKAGVSRQREFLADASAVQFTRQTDGIAGALLKIAKGSRGSKLDSAETEEVSHMLFADGLGSKTFATHPPLLDRIKRLNAAVLLEQKHKPASRREPPTPPAASTAKAAGHVGVPGLEIPGFGTPMAGVLLGSVLASELQVTGARQVVDSISEPGLAEVSFAQKLRESLPPVLVGAAHSIERAEQLVLALALGQPGHRDAQRERIQKVLGDKALQSVDALLFVTETLHPVQRLPLLDLAVPALRHRPPRDLARLRTLVDELVQIDSHIDPFEFCLGHLLAVRLNDLAHPPDEQHGKQRLIRLDAQLATVLGVLAHHGHPDDAELARRAYERGMYGALPNHRLPYRAPGQDWMERLVQALDQLNGLHPLDKEAVLKAMVDVVLHDGQVRTEESELLRVMAANLHVPLPPLLGGNSGIGKGPSE